MSSASDISNLFQMVGGDPSQYQEVERTEQMQGSRGRWNMVVAEQPNYIVAAPVKIVPEIAQMDVAGEAEAVRPVGPAETEAAEPQRLITWTIPAIASEPPPVVRAISEQPVAHADPEPVVAAQQSAPLSSVFARLLERKMPPADPAPRKKS